MSDEKEKDPYLDELDEMTHGSLGESADTEAISHEATRIDLEAPPLPEEELGDDPKTPHVSPAAREMMDLSPDIPVQLVVVIGRKNLTVRDLLGFRSGNVVDFDRVPSEPVDLVVGGRVIGKGELVNVEGKLGVRILKLLK